jgi:hypothetical protein
MIVIHNAGNQMHYHILQELLGEINVMLMKDNEVPASLMIRGERLFQTDYGKENNV